MLAHVNVKIYRALKVENVHNMLKVQKLLAKFHILLLVIYMIDQLISWRDFTVEMIVLHVKLIMNYIIKVVY